MASASGRPRGSRRVSALRFRGGAQGFQILEALIAVVILTVSLGALAILASRQGSSARDVDVLDRLENAVAADLGWLKTYAKYWRMTSGPYNLSCTQAGFQAGCTPFVVSTTVTEYDPDPTGDTCPRPSATPPVADTALSDAFVTAAGSAVSATIPPERPYGVAVGSTTLLDSATDTLQPRLPSGTALTRTISLGKNLIFLSYSFTGENAAPYQFLREVSIRPEASAWCP
jgi:hypothetical protein